MSEEEEVKPDSPSQPVRTERVVEQASRESFPASDPPSFTPTRSGGADNRPDDEPLVDESPEQLNARDWADSMCKAMDARDADGVAALVTADAAVRVGSAKLLVGRENARKWLGSYLDSLGDTVHHLVDVRCDKDAVFIESEVNVRTADGVKLMRPEAISARLRQGLASRLTIYGAPSLPEKEQQDEPSE